MTFCHNPGTNRTEKSISPLDFAVTVPAGPPPPHRGARGPGGARSNAFLCIPGGCGSEGSVRAVRRARDHAAA
eukprot:894245-Rhodomonas_salina.7